MAKRRRKKPNISQTVLEQARQGVIDEGRAGSTGESSAPAPAAPTAAIADLLANPTKVVTEDDLRADYGFVIKDLRNMGILAAGLFVALIVVSLVLL